MESSKKIPEPRFIVLQKMLWDKRKYYPPRVHPISGRLVFDIIQLPAWAAEVFNHTGCICDMEKFDKKGMLVHPDSIKV